MNFSEFRGNSRITEYFQHAIDRGRLAHAYLFTGTSGVGKRTLALLICKALLCRKSSPDGACGECPSCHKFDSGNHPDFHLHGAEGLYFKIDVVRRIIHEVSLKPVESPYKCFILNDVDLMRDEAANSFLKVLEEPPGATVFFLIAQRAESILSTIRSRCIYFEFQPLRTSEVADWLINSGGLTRDEAEDAALYSHGSIERAQTLNAGQYKEIRDKVLSALEAALLPRAYFALTDSVRAITVDREEMPERLLILEELVRDLLLLKSSPDAALMHHDAKTRLTALAANANRSALQKFYEELVETREAILKINANIGLSLQALFLPLRLTADRVRLATDR